MGLGRRLVGQMERLRVVFARELDHFLARDLVRAEIGLGADLEIFEIDHAPALSGRSVAPMQPFVDFAARMVPYRALAG